MNDNCLDGLRCPKCGSREPFWIEAKAEFKVYDSGTDHFHDVEWDETSPCRCEECGHWSTVADFRSPAKYRCDNCTKTYGNRDELKEARDLLTRVDEGGPMPSGECPSCGALCYLIERTKTINHSTDGDLLDCRIQDWRIGEGELVPEEDQTAYRLRLYRQKVTAAIRVTITEENSEKGLDLLAEINQGRPCVHIGVTDTGTVCHAVGTREGIVVVPDGDTNRPQPWHADRRWYDDQSAVLYPADLD